MNIPLNIDLQQILLHFFNFSLLTGGLYLLLYQPVKAFMEKRQAYYREQDAQAAELEAAAQSWGSAHASSDRANPRLSVCATARARG